MKLKIDTSSREEIVLRFDNKEYKTNALDLKSQKLLPFLVECLEKENKTLKDISSIEVVRGPGSFTGLRIGASVANTLGWVLNIPVNDKNVKTQGGVSPIY